MTDEQMDEMREALNRAYDALADVVDIADDAGEHSILNRASTAQEMCNELLGRL